MRLSQEIELVGKGLFLNVEKTLVIGDLHLGYEEMLINKGVLVPKAQLKETLRDLEELVKKVKPLQIVINGDLKHEFGRVLGQEWKDTLTLIDWIVKKGIKLIVIKGTHDPTLKPILSKRFLKTVDSLQLGKIFIFHGDKEMKIPSGVETLIIGHEHPAITLREGRKTEKFKCFLRGRWKGKELIVLPAFNPLMEGTDILTEPAISPLVKQMKRREVFVIGAKEVLNFGKI
ncbi:metallophosphoesterase [Candidatus Woesearchaeota archaeon]|nr:metallophosphoesterase [Candidatus Woesearchaeota archaeon]